MADDELRIKIKAELDESGIKKTDIPKIEDNLAKSDDGHVKLIGQLAIDETRKKISAQLKNLSFGDTKLNLGINTDGIKSQLNGAVSATDSVVKSLKEKFNLSGNLTELKTAVKDYLEVFKTGDTDKIKQSFTEVEDVICSITTTIPTTTKGWNEYETVMQGCLSIGEKITANSDKTEKQLAEESSAVKVAIADYNSLKLAKESSLTSDTGNSISRSKTYKNDDGSFTQTRNYDGNNNLKSISETENFEAITKQMEKANAAGIKLKATLDGIKSAYSDKNATRTISDDNISKLDEKYVDVANAIERVQKANVSEYTSAVANANAEISRLKDLVKEYQNAEHAAKDFRSKDIPTSVNIEQNDLTTFIAKIKSSIVPINQMQAEVNDLKATLSGVTDSESLTTYYNKLDIVKSKFSALESEAKLLNKSLTLKTDQTVLSNRIIAYMNDNTKAAKKYREEFERIQAQLKNRNLDTTGLKNLRKEFQELTTRIKAAGDNTDTLGVKIKKAVTKFTSWMSLTTIIAASARAVKQMVDNVIELDNQLLELSKVSDLTASGIEEVTKKAYELGKTVAKTGTQTLEAITTFKRAGYDMQESMELAKDALMLTNVAEGIDTTAESAQYLINVMKGFNETPEFATKILDVVNEVDILAS